MKTAILIGLTPQDWAEMTPYELSIAIEGFTERKEIEMQESVTMAWLGEYYHRIKKLPTLKEVLKDFGPKQKQKKQMTDDEMLAEVKRLNALFGGIDATKDGDSNST